MDQVSSFAWLSRTSTMADFLNGWHDAMSLCEGKADGWSKNEPDC